MNFENLFQLQSLIGKLKTLLQSCDLVSEEVKLTLTDEDKNQLDDRLSDDLDKLNVINEIAHRNTLKVVFIGRTSSGKSSVINALLGQAVLPSGSGHTTTCFVEVKGTNKENPYILLNLPNGEEHSLELGSRSLMELISSMGQEKLDPNFRIKIFWPRKKSPVFLVFERITLIDSPGLDISPDSDSGMDEVCLDADLFVWVMNGESTVMMREKNFFTRISNKLSKPNILVVINRWDCTAEEEEYLIDAAHEQHLERIGTFLQHGLQICSSYEEARKKIFFVSAKEILQQHENEENCSSPLTEMRNTNWQRFMKQLVDALAKANRGGKYVNHLDTSLAISQALSQRNHQLLQICHNRYSFLQSEMIKCGNQLDSLQNGMTNLNIELKSDIQEMLELVHQDVKLGLEEELQDLDIIVYRFKPVFHSEKSLGEAYLHHLISELEEKLALKANESLTSKICDRIRNTQNLVKEKVAQILPTSKKELVNVKCRKMPVDFSQSFDLKAILEDFNAETKFHFSMTPSKILRKYRNWEGEDHVLAINGNASTSADANSDLTLVKETKTDLVPKFTQEIISFAFGWPENTSGGYLFFGAISQCCNWRIVGIVGAVFATLYCCERFHWRYFSEEQEWKRQFIEFAKAKLDENFLCHVANVSRDACQKELAASTALACAGAEGVCLELKHDLETICYRHQRLLSAMEKLNDSISNTNEVAMGIGTFKRTMMAL